MSDRVSWNKRLRDLVERAATLPAGEWSTFVARESNDPELAKQALELLRHPTTGGDSDFLRGIVALSLEELQAELQPAVPKTIGPYEVIGVLGVGGMGAVYRVQQRQPVERQLAVKVIPPGPGWRDLAVRFRTELATLAAMGHRYIASLIDAGEGDVGPWLAMELVDGESLTVWCDEQASAVRARLELFMMVCDGVHHAHTRGVVHRDLKPSNILVAIQDDAAVPKVLDFGIAKVLDASITGAASAGQTAANRPLGTREYMAPEQTGNGVPVDTRADIYSLGVILYELVCGELPFPGLTGMDTATAVAVIREREPARPSQRLLRSTDGVAVAQRRATTVLRLRRALARDLDWIVLKALRKSPSDRYQSVSELRADVQRCLLDQPVLARTGALAYQWERFVRRHRVAVAAGAVVVATVALAMFGILRSEQTLAAQVRDYELLANLVTYDRLVEAEVALRPARSDMLPALRRWMTQAEAMLATREAVLKKLADLLEHAPKAASGDYVPPIEHPIFAETEVVRRRLAARRYAHEIRTGQRQFVLPDAPVRQEWLSKPMHEVYERIGTLSNPPLVGGEQSIGLLCACVAADSRRGSLFEAAHIAALADAYLANGMDAAAREAVAAAADMVGPMDRVAREDHAYEMEGRISESARLVKDDEARLQLLDEEAPYYRAAYFERAPDQYQYESLIRFLGTLRDVRDLAVEVGQRIEWAARTEDQHPLAKHTWREVREALAAADDIVASRLYRGRRLDFDEKDVEGLVPIGMNPVTKLWEFYDLRTAAGDRRDPGKVSIPVQDREGKIHVTGETGVVFVLLPGGRFLMGAQKDDQKCDNHDADAHEYEQPVHEVELGPFFMGKCEVTQGQWSRIAGGDQKRRFPSSAPQGQYKVFNFHGSDVVEHSSLACPVESVDWTTCVKVLAACDMLLPTEAQWEYAFRASGSGVWAGIARSDIGMYANVLDQRAIAWNNSWRDPEQFDDCRAGLSPAGSYRPNAYGLCDMMGNVSEWCRDSFELYRNPLRPGDGLRSAADSAVRIFRGGNLAATALTARASYRGQQNASTRLFWMGLRASRPLRRSGS